MSMLGNLLVWVLFARTSKTLHNAHGLGRVDSVLYCQLTMLAVELLINLTGDDNG